MTTKTRSCDQCAWWTSRIDCCAKGHSPRFYKPRLGQQHIQGGGDWGWRRRCDDYQEKA